MRPCPTAPLSRRDLRRAEKASRRWTALRRPLVVLPFSVNSVAVAVAVTAALLGGGAAEVHLDRVAEAVHQELVAERAREDANTQRALRADGQRLHAQAASYAGSKRTQALAAARSAVAEARSVAAIAVPDVAAEVLAPLDSATADLAALIVATPPGVAETPDALETVPAEPMSAEPTTAEPTTAEAVPPAAERPEPVQSEPARAATVPAETVLPETVHSGASATGPAEAEPVAADPVVADTALVIRSYASSLEASAQMLEAALAVTQLSTQVHAEAVTNAASAAADQLAAEEAQRAADEAQRAADEVQRKVDAVLSAANGEIGLDALCAPAFASRALLRCDAVLSLEALDAAFGAQFGRHLSIVSSYRSYADQVAVKALRGGLAAAPGSSNHGLAIAVDLAGFGSVGEFGQPEYLWMKENAAEFGWVHPEYMEPGHAGPFEPWHWEYETGTAPQG